MTGKRPNCQYRFGSSKPLTVLSSFLFGNPEIGGPEIRDLSSEEFKDVVGLAHSHHVVVRFLQAFGEAASSGGHGHQAEWAANALRSERERIETALAFLHRICERLEGEGCDPIVIKSLDHWPDLGSDLDLYTDASPAIVISTMKESFNARLAARSWGDRLANKWNFIVPELPELVEVHIGRLGQTGEQLSFANSLAARGRSVKIEDYAFRVPSAEDRLMICTLQRMYRHFYMRLCDIVDTANLVETETVDYEFLRASAQAAGIWEGLATFLMIVSDYTENYRGKDLNLPPSVGSAARFDGDQICFGKGFLRVPILPHSVKLYASELAGLLLQGEIKSTARLTLLPCLATAAAIGQKITGSDKGIW